MNLVTIVKNNYAQLESVSAQYAYYNVNVPTEDASGYNTFRIAIPLNEIGTAVLRSKEKVITLMRWVRKAIETNELVFIGQTQLDNEK